jgi:hypothetical protein
MATAPTPIIFVPECHADTALMLTLLGENRPELRATAAARQRLRPLVDHEQGIGNVGNKMRLQQREFGATRRVVGLVDLDAKFSQHTYLREFTTLLDGHRQRGQGDFALLQHAAAPHHYLIAINPAFEKWLQARAAELGKTLDDFGLPTDFKLLKRYCKKEEAEYDPRLRGLLDAIAAANFPVYRALAEFVAQVMNLAMPLPIAEQ